LGFQSSALNHASLKHGSVVKYKGGVNKFKSFCAIHGIVFPPPARWLDEILPRFFGYLALDKGLGSSVIHTTLYAIEDYYLCQRLYFPKDSSVILFSHKRTKKFCSIRCPTQQTKPCSLAIASSLFVAMDKGSAGFVPLPYSDRPACAFSILWISGVRLASLIKLAPCHITFSFPESKIHIKWHVKGWGNTLCLRSYPFHHPLLPSFMSRVFALVAARSDLPSDVPIFEGVSGPTLQAWVYRYLQLAGMDLEAVPDENLSKASAYSLRRGAAQALEASLLAQGKSKAQRKAAIAEFLMHKSEGSQAPYLRRSKN
jgi:hypothetical protein